MKTLKAVFWVSGLAVLLLLNGCTNKGSVNQSTTGSFNHQWESNENPPAETAPIASVQDNFLEDSNALKAQTFDNMSFVDSYFEFPQADTVYILEYNITGFDISPENAYGFMCEKLDEFFPAMFSDEEKANDIRFFGLKNVEEFPTLKQYKAMDEITYYTFGGHPSTGINPQSSKCKDCYLEADNGVLWFYDNGRLAKRCGFERSLASFDVLSEYPVVYRTENLKSERKFHLESGDISIAEAVKTAEKQLSELELSEREIPFKLRVQNVNVVDAGDNCYAFYFGIVPEYKDMKYNCLLPDNTVWGFSTIDDTTNEREACGEAIMCEKDEICRFRLYNPASVYDIVECSSSTSIVPLKNAAEVASKYLTAGISFDVLSVSSVYKPFSDIKYNQNVDYESYENRKITVRPCWRFVLQPLTGNTDRLYYIYVDMLSGEPYRTVQLTESDVKYD